MKKLIFTIILLILLCNILYANEKPRVAILPFEAVGVSDLDAQVALRLFEIECSRTDSFTLIESSHIEEVTSQSYRNCLTEICATEYGKILSADYIVLGSFFQIASNYVLNIKIIDVSLGLIIIKEKNSLNNLTELPDSIESLVSELIMQTQFYKTQFVEPVDTNYDNFNNLILDLENKIQLITTSELENFENQIIHTQTELSNNENKYTDLEKRVGFLLDNIRKKKEGYKRTHEREKLNTELDKLKLEYENAKLLDNNRNDNQTLLGFLSLSSIGITAISGILAGVSYSEYSNAKTTAAATSARSKTIGFDIICAGAGLSSAICSIAFLANSGEDDAPEINKQISEIKTKIAKLENE